MASLGGGIQSVAELLAHPWFTVPIGIELSLSIALTILILKGWRFARLAVVVAVLLWLPDLFPSPTRTSTELNYPLGLYFA